MNTARVFVDAAASSLPGRDGDVPGDTRSAPSPSSRTLPAAGATAETDPLRRGAGRPSWLRIWRTGLARGVRILPREPVLGLKRVVLPVSYWRTVEFAYVWGQLATFAGVRRVLDLGSPKDLAVHLAEHYGFDIVSADILEEESRISHRLERARSRDGAGPGRVRAVVQDGRYLGFRDGSFDAAFSVSVLEHIPGAGDTLAMAELIRVVRKGGVVIGTVPYDRAYRETFVRGAVYERDYDGEPVFFERHYDAVSLANRLLFMPSVRVVNVEVWGEGRLRGERWLQRLGPLRAVASPLEAPLAGACLRPIGPKGEGHPMAAFFTLRKT